MRNAAKIVEALRAQSMTVALVGMERHRVQRCLLFAHALCRRAGPDKTLRHAARASARAQSSREPTHHWNRGGEQRTGVYLQRPDRAPASAATAKITINMEVAVSQLMRIARLNGMAILHPDRMLKVNLGSTTPEEALAIVPPQLIL